MDTTDTGIKILQLKVKKDQIIWFFWNFGTTQISPEVENLEMDPLRHRTIDLLIEHLQFLAAQQQEVASKMLRPLVRVLGEHLYRELFVGQIHIRLSDALNEKDLKLLRVELEFEDQNSKLARWPWEYLCRPEDKTSNSGTFLATSLQLVLNRKLSLDPHQSPLKMNTPKPIKVLLVVSGPSDRGPVQCNDVLKQIRELHSAKVIEVHEMVEIVDIEKPQEPIVTREQFKKEVGKFHPNIIHFIGHGQCIDTHGAIGFIDGGRVQWEIDEDFATWAALSNDLKLVFLQACESATPAAFPDSYNSVSGMALQLAHKNIPAVVAMQYKVESEIANTFACSFYNALLSEKVPVDLAVKAGREAINDKFSHNPQYHAFGLPVLYLSSYESIILQESPPVGIKCPRCDFLSPPNINFCGQCALPFICSKCKNRLPIPLPKFCPECGKAMKGKSWSRREDPVY